MKLASVMFLGVVAVVASGCPKTAEDLAECGNAIVEPGEECDDGNLVETDLCDNSCRTVVPQGDPEGCFADRDGTYAGDDGCGITNFLLVTEGSIVLNSFGDNPDGEVFLIDAADENQANGEGVIIFSVDSHTCTLTCTNAFSLTLVCNAAPPSTNTCTEIFSKI